MKPFAAFPSASSGLKSAFNVKSAATRQSYLDQLRNSPKPPRPDGIPFPQLYDFFIHPLTPLVFGVVYFVVAKVLSHRQNGKNRIKGKVWDALVIAHNVALAVYSAWTFLTVAPLMFGAYFRALSNHGPAGLAHVFCDSDNALWTSTVFPKMCYLFYLSKYYEVVDTAIILAKGKKVKGLQSYHHAGAVLTMFAGYRSQSPPIWIFCVFNSLIHTIMYTYYTFSALKWPFPRFLKQALTRLQITQFIVGGSLAASYLFIPLPTFAVAQGSISAVPSFGQLSHGSMKRAGEICLGEAAPRAAVWLNVLYLIFLTKLFVDFFIDSYRKTAAKKVD